jgi:endonuclease/exonuclease/phosphatase family metal-dependent hydrolase
MARCRRLIVVLTTFCVCLLCLAVPAVAAAEQATRLCPGVEASGELANPAQRDPYLLYVPTGATVRIAGLGDVLGRDWTGGWQSIFFIGVEGGPNVVYDLLGNYYGGPYLNQHFGGAWTNYGPSRDVLLTVGNDFGSNIRYRFTATLEASLAASGCGLPQVRVMTWNVERRGSQDVPSLGQVMVDGGAQIVGLQEVPSATFKDLVQWLTVATGQTWRGYWVDEMCHLRIQVALGRCGDDGIGVLTSLPVGSYLDRRFPDSDHGYQRLEVTVGNTPMLFYNTHIEKGHEDKTRPKTDKRRDDKVLKMRAAEVASLLAQTATDEASGVAQVIGGDFNSRPWHCAMAAVRKAGFSDAWAAGQPREAIPTLGTSDSCLDPGSQGGQLCGYRAAPEVEPPFLCGFSRGDHGAYPLIRIDYLYGSRNATASDLYVGIMPATVPTPGVELVEKVGQLSDHLPVFATMTLAAAGPNVL